MKNNITQYRLLRDLAFFFMLGFLVYHLFPFPPIVWRLGLVGVSTIGIFMHMSRYKFVAVEQSMLLFVSLIVIHFLLSFIWRKPLLTNFGNVLCSMMPVSLFFCSCCQGNDYSTIVNSISSSKLCGWLLLFFACGTNPS